MKPLRERHAEAVCASQEVAKFWYRRTPVNVLGAMQFRGASAREDYVARILINHLVLLVV